MLLAFVLGVAVGVFLCLAALFLLLFNTSPTPSTLTDFKDPQHISAFDRQRLRLSVHKPPSSQATVVSNIQDYINQILENSKGAPESCTWINVVAQRFWRNLIRMATPTKVESFINRVVATIPRPSLLAPLTFHDVQVGRVLPVLHSVRVLAWSDRKPIELEFDLTYMGDARFGVQTALVVNMPVQGLASLPVQLAISALSIKCLIRVRIDPPGRIRAANDDYSKLLQSPSFLSSPPSSSSSSSSSSSVFASPSSSDARRRVAAFYEAPKIAIALAEKPTINFDLDSEIGYNKTISGLPKLKPLLLQFAQQALTELLILPKFHTLKIFDSWLATCWEEEENDQAEAEEQELYASLIRRPSTKESKKNM